MDVGSGKGYPSSALSNFAPHRFVFDEVECAGMEGLVQAFKFDKVHMQIAVCATSGIAAKRRGRGRSKHWQRVQTLWWGGQAYDRHGKPYQELLDRAFNALATNESFRKALLATQNAVLTHTIGRHDASETVLTRAEFCSRLHRLRDEIRAGIR